MGPLHVGRLGGLSLYLFGIMVSSCAAVLELGEGSQAVETAVAKATGGAAKKCIVDCSGPHRLRDSGPDSPRYQALQAAADYHMEHVEPAMARYKVRRASW